MGKTVPDLACIDGIRVGQVISNLLNNAVKFTEAGAIAIQVDYEDDRLAFRIRDTGIGIALEQQRTSSSRSSRWSPTPTAGLAAPGSGLPSVINSPRKWGA